MKNINHKAPVLCRKTIIINSHSVDVWNVITDINHWPVWQKNITSAKLTEGFEPDMGFEWRQGGIKIRSTIHTIEPFIHFGWEGKLPGLHTVHNWKLKELNNQTEVLVEVSIDGVFANIFKILLQHTANKNNGRWLEFLKIACEKRGGA